MTDKVLDGETTEFLGDAAEIARLMGLPSWRRMSSLSLVDQIERGLPLQAAERIAQVMAPGTLARSTRCCRARPGRVFGGGHVGV